MSKPSEVHMGTAKRILRYLKGTLEFGVFYQPCDNPRLIAYSDSDWAGSVDDMKSTSGYAFTFGSGTFSWNSKKQDIVAQSTAEAEYVAASAAVNQVIWLRKILQDLGYKQEGATKVMVDNKSAIAIAKNPVCFSKTKHMKVRFYALRDAEQEKEVELIHCPSEFQLADILTKALPTARFEFLRSKLGVTPKVSRRSVQGDVYDHESLVNAIKQVDVVISTVGYFVLADQVKIIDAIKEAGNVKRFFPSEFGVDVDRTSAVEPAKSAFAVKAGIRRAVEAAGIPYTYVSANNFAGLFLPSMSQPGATSPPRDKIVILGDGNPKAVFNQEEDIATYTIRAVDDPRTLNKTLYIKPSGNTISFNDLVLDDVCLLIVHSCCTDCIVVHIMLLCVTDSPPPTNVFLAIGHAVFVKGDQTNFEIELSFGVEASEL
ncbi:phenylcoumaran benzylic ether reductase POP1-like [Silene latifolia]|uniref:phenylcoumaran benzylic ether reductase POP1-like n=1 Tax=Silene latifolia TaxID=37657 RepID=UPI003D78328C